MSETFFSICRMSELYSFQHTEQVGKEWVISDTAIVGFMPYLWEHWRLCFVTNVTLLNLDNSLPDKVQRLTVSSQKLTVPHADNSNRMPRNQHLRHQLLQGGGFVFFFTAVSPLSPTVPSSFPFWIFKQSSGYLGKNPPPAPRRQFFYFF